MPVLAHVGLNTAGPSSMYEEDARLGLSDSTTTASVMAIRLAMEQYSLEKPIAVGFRA